MIVFFRWPEIPINMVAQEYFTLVVGRQKVNFLDTTCAGAQVVRSLGIVEVRPRSSHNLLCTINIETCYCVVLMIIVIITQGPRHILVIC